LPTSAVSAPRPFVPWHEEHALSGLRDLVRDWEERGKEALSRNPLESLLALVCGGAAVYYLAERGRSPRVNTYWDALEYVSTCASVGYSNIFPETPVGKMVASVLFLLGPTLTSQALEPARPPGEAIHPGATAGEHALAERLDAILAELRALRGLSS
jgi:hypothetical protein